MGTKAFRDKVRFYEENKAHIGTLSYEERIDVDLDYAICLFEIGKYHKFLSMCDPLIEVVIMDNMFTYNGVNIYNDLLFKKAACLFNTGQYTKTEKVLKALVKLEPESGVMRTLYGKCKRKQERDWYESVKAVAIVLLISGVFFAFMELLVVKPFYSDYIATFRSTKILFFIIGVIALIANEAYLNYVIGKEIGYKIDLAELRKRFKKEDNL